MLKGTPGNSHPLPEEGVGQHTEAALQSCLRPLLLCMALLTDVILSSVLRVGRLTSLYSSQDSGSRVAPPKELYLRSPSAFTGSRDHRQTA